MGFSLRSVAGRSCIRMGYGKPGTPTAWSVVLILSHQRTFPGVTAADEHSPRYQLEYELPAPWEEP